MVKAETTARPQACRWTGRLVAWLVAAALPPAVFLSLGFLLSGFFGFPLGMRPTEYIDLSYGEYASKVGIEGFNPNEGRQISFKKCPSIDSTNCWWKLTIPARQYEALRQAEDHATVIGEAVKPVRKKTSNESRTPRNWPLPDAPPPSWWKPPLSGHEIECTQWEAQLEGRAVGRYWVYDRRTETLWIWRWNRQHFKFERPE
jgi:hypothetical protein